MTFKGKASTLSDTAITLKQGALEEISKYIDINTLKLGNKGNQQRFSNFLDNLFGHSLDP